MVRSRDELNENVADGQRNYAKRIVGALHGVHLSGSRQPVRQDGAIYALLGRLYASHVMRFGRVGREKDTAGKEETQRERHGSRATSAGKMPNKSK